MESNENRMTASGREEPLNSEFLTTALENLLLVSSAKSKIYEYSLQ
jgi:hypothetical protein